MTPIFYFDGFFSLLAFLRDRKLLFITVPPDARNSKENHEKKSKGAAMKASNDSKEDIIV